MTNICKSRWITQPCCGFCAPSLGTAEYFGIIRDLWKLFQGRIMRDYGALLMLSGNAPCCRTWEISAIFSICFTMSIEFHCSINSMKPQSCSSFTLASSIPESDNPALLYSTSPPVLGSITMQVSHGVQYRASSENGQDGVFPWKHLSACLTALLYKWGDKGPMLPWLLGVPATGSPLMRSLSPVA